MFSYQDVQDLLEWSNQSISRDIKFENPLRFTTKNNIDFMRLNSGHSTYNNILMTRHAHPIKVHDQN